MKSGIDPTVDYAFKQVLGNKARVALPIDLLNAVLDLPPGKPVRQIQLLNPFTEAVYAGGKEAILDVKIRDENGQQYDLEMQRRVPWCLDKRLVYYGSRLHGEQLLEGDYYQTLRPTHLICFVTENCIVGDSEYRHRFVFHDPVNQVTFSDDIQIHVFELGKFDRTVEQIQTRMEQWCYLLKHGADLDLERLPPQLDVPIIRQALEVLVMISQSELERYRYLDRLQAQRDEATERRGNEIQRQQLQEEAERIRVETERVKEEAERVRVETERVKEEAERLREEAERVKEEAERVKVEAERVQEEDERIRVETERVKEEAERVREARVGLQELQEQLLEREEQVRLATERAEIGAQVHVFQRLLKQPLTSRNDLQQLPLADLKHLLAQLERLAFPE